jgi:small membrane protein
MLIQAILITTAFVLFVFFIRSSHSVRTQAVKRIGFVVFLILNLDAVLRPDDTTWLAHKVGVGRGADLVLYLLVVAFAFYSVNTFLRFRNLERRFTDLARAIALRDAQPPAVTDAPPPRMPVQTARDEARDKAREAEPESSLTGGPTR